MAAPLRVVIGEDDVLLREGIARLLAEAGFDVVAEAADAKALLRKGLPNRPSVLIADVNMPPGHGDDGLRAAIELRRQRPETGVLVLSQYYEDYALASSGSAEGVGYLLKERVGDVESFIDAVTRVPGAAARLTRRSSGGCSARRQRDRLLDRLSPRERDVLAVMAEGKSNHGIAQTLLDSRQRWRSTSRASFTSFSSIRVRQRQGRRVGANAARLPTTQLLRAHSRLTLR